MVIKTFQLEVQQLHFLDVCYNRKVFGGSNTDTEAQGQVSGNTNIIVNSGITVNGNIYGGSKGVINGTSINVNTGAINGNTNITLNTGTINGDIYGWRSKRWSFRFS